MGSFQPNCTVPPPNANFVFGPQIRGTLDIVWTSLTILLLCTWSIQHPNVPLPIRPKEARGGIIRWTYQGFGKIGGAMLTLYAPEMYFAKAITELISCWYARKDVEEMAEKDRVEWTLTHSFFAHMGGFMIEFDGLDRPKDQSASSTDVQLDPKANDTGISPADTSSPTGQQAVKTSETSNALSSKTPLSSEAQRAQEPSEKRSVEADMVPATPILEAGVQNQRNQGLRGNGNTASSVGIVDRITGCWVPSSPNFDMNTRLVRPTMEAMNEVETYTLEKSARTIADLDKQIGSTGWHVSPENHDAASRALASVSWADLRRAGIKRISDIPNWHCNAANLQGNVWVLDYNQFLEARRRGITARLPDVSKRTLESQSKTDVVSKIIALYQVIWLVIQLGNRWQLGTGIAQLEILTLGFAVCSVLTYAALWKKPQDVTEPVYVPAARYATVEDVIVLGAKGRRAMNCEPSPRSLAPDSVARIFNGDNEVLGWVPGMAAVGISAVFGAVHCIAWNFEFPTYVEKKMWQASALITVLAPVLLLMTMDTIRACSVVVGLNRKNLGILGVAWNVSRVLIFLMAVFLYYWSRVFILVEAFRSLFYLSPSTYQTSDVVNLPHW